MKDATIVERSTGDPSPTTRVLSAAAAIAVALLALGCSSRHPGAPTVVATLTETVTPSGTPTVTFPVAPAHDDKPVWDFVREWQGANISPILRPGWVPSRFDTVTVDQLPNKQDPYLLQVSYAGPGKRLSIAAGGINPPPPAPGGYERKATVRGHDAVLVVNPGTGPGSGVSLSWSEPGNWVPQSGATTVDHIPYALFSQGLTEQEMRQVADSLTPIAP